MIKADSRDELDPKAKWFAATHWNVVLATKDDDGRQEPKHSKLSAARMVRPFTRSSAHRSRGQGGTSNSPRCGYYPCMGEQFRGSPGHVRGVFATTHWSVVVRAGDSRSPDAAAAMERLCQTYWYPLYLFVRRKGHSHEDASDLTQAFFAKFLEKDYLRTVDESLGKFRTFLLTAMTHFLANEWDKSQAQKRGGGQWIISFDDAKAEERYRLEPVERTTPETLFERRWAETVLEMVLARLAAEHRLRSACKGALHRAQFPDYRRLQDRSQGDSGTTAGS